MIENTINIGTQNSVLRMTIDKTIVPLMNDIESHF